MYVSPSSFVCSVLLVLPLILPLARILHLRIILLERSSQHATSQSRLVMENPANRSFSHVSRNTFIFSHVPLKKENGQTVMVPLFQSQENIAGKISVEPVSGKKVEHNGIKVELLGQIEMYFDRGNFYDFTSLVRELDVPGEIYERKTYPFEFSTVEMPYETYNGVNVRLR
ncbi:hypothetical protein H5410_022414 [Solanum commersonii]|uniref:Uncharacterized protein n=1 Tax=Solanum commersonii TaxID=4109 RepID=A0A9J5ZFD2_SOLCO|nr:hypothetical protein H5410_022414 [Solanum commersonii]